MEVNEVGNDTEQKHTIAAYLEMDSDANEQYEFYEGEVKLLPISRNQHKLVTRNILTSLAQDVKGKDCKAAGSEVRVHVPKNTLFAHPDISIVCDDAEYFNNDESILLNPAVLIEVLSPLTDDYDRGDKFNRYKDIASLKEYILVDPETIHISVYTRNKHSDWKLKAYKSIDDTLTIDTVKADIWFEDIYKDTKAIGSKKR